MCGIVAWVNRRGISRPILERMRDTLIHRGPDAHGIFINSQANVGLAHRRLAIIDPERGHQPMSDREGKVWIVFNGAIYNYPELKRELLAEGYPIRTRSDTEVLLYSYIHWGESCLDRLNGMYAFVIYDSRRHIIFAARDRLGIKPLYYYRGSDEIIIASEPKAILVSGSLPAEPDHRALVDYLTFQYYLKDRTLFKGIKVVPPGHSLTVNLNARTLKPELRLYWDIQINFKDHRPEEELVEELRALIRDSVKLRLRADVPLGAHLSGGLDSSTVATIASTFLKENGMMTFTGRFDEGENYDESSYAKIVAEHISAEYNEVTITPADWLRYVDKLIYYMDYPQAGPGLFPQYMVSKLARDKVKVVLGGQGGDELFLGYTRYLIIYLEALVRRAIEGDVQALDTLRQAVNGLPQLKGYLTLLRRHLMRGFLEEPERRFFNIINRMDTVSDLISPDVYNVSGYSVFEEFCEVFNTHGTADIVDRMSYYEIKTSLVALLHVEDRTSMALSLESRVPLLDHRLVEMVFRIPSDLKLRDGQLKYIFKRTVEPWLPRKILQRKDKRGFPTPLNKWFKTCLKEWLTDLLTDRRTLNRGIFNRDKLLKLVETTGEYSRSLWGIVNLELWFRTFIDSPISAHSLSSAIRCST